MNEFENTNLPFLEQGCIETFGNERGKKIFGKTLEIYRELTRKADYRNNEAIRNHMTAKLFPAMSYYKALQALEIDDAIEKVKKETQKAALVNKQNNAKFARMPFVFTMYRMGVKKHMAKDFPPEGRKTEWVRCDGKEIHFNLRSCLYHDICVEKGCPELCQVYCENDNIAFSGLMPKIRFERAGTIGEGAVRRICGKAPRRVSDNDRRKRLGTFGRRAAKNFHCPRALKRFARHPPRRSDGKDGKVAEQGSPEELLAKGGIYAKMCQLQQQSGEWRI